MYLHVVLEYVFLKACKPIPRFIVVYTSEPKLHEILYSLVIANMKKLE